MLMTKRRCQRKCLVRGHSRRFANVASMSALHPIATFERTFWIGSEGPSASFRNCDEHVRFPLVSDAVISTKLANLISVNFWR